MTFNILIMLLILLPLVQGIKMSENDNLYEKCANGELSTAFFEQAMASDLVAAVFLASLSPPKRSATTKTSLLISDIKMPKNCPYDIMALILKADADEDGKLSAIEQITLAIEVLKTVVDKDRNGCVSEKEVEDYVQKCVKRSEEYAGID